MRSTTSWYKHEMMKQNFRQVGWISLIYFLIIFFAVPLNIFMQLNRAEPNAYYHYDSIFEFGIVVQVFALYIAPVLMAMFILRYLHQKDASDFIHSLPISRTKLFWQQAGFGLLALWLPVITNAVLIHLINRFFDTSVLYREIDLGYWFMTKMILITFIFSVSMVLGVLTGITIVQGIFTFVILFFPVGFTFLLTYNLNFMLIGFPVSHFITDRILEFSPLTDLPGLLIFQEDTTTKFLIYFILTVIFIIKAQLLYKHRPSEAATQAIAFQMLKPIFIYSFTFCFTLIGGVYFGLSQQSYAGIVFGYLIFSIIGYFISQMIVHKTWRIFREWREYVIFFIAFTTLMVMAHLDVTGFQSRIPDADKIESAFINDNVYVFSHYANRYDGVTGFKSDQEIELVHKYHQYLIDNLTTDSAISPFSTTISIVYQLKNGKELIREYSVPQSLEEHHLFEEIKGLPTYKKYTNELYLINPSTANHIRFFTFVPYKELNITDRNQIMELINLLREDVLNESDEADHKGIGIEISYMDRNDLLNHSGSIYVDLTSAHDRVIDWLYENNLADQILLLADDIESVVLAYSDQIDSFYEDTDYYGHQFYPSSILSGLEQIEITDQKIINDIVEQIDFNSEGHDYLIAFYLKGMSNPYIVLLNESILPTELLEQIN